MRGVNVNGTAVLAARLKCGWTQDDLAQHADVDVKTVRKAEQGKRLDMGPLSRLASALQVDAQSLIQTPASTEELQRRRREVVLEWNRAWIAADMERFLAVYSEHAELRLPGGPNIPFGGVYRGREEIRKVHELIWSTVPQDPIAINDSDIFINDKAVTVKACQRAYTPSGEAVLIECVQVFTFDGLLIADQQVEYDTLEFAKKFQFPT